jgi:mannose-6-phosphate isomerase-like protein (cupin superfamily)
MATIEKKSLNQPEQTKQMGRVKVEVITIGGLTFQRYTAQPGWRWSEDVKPVVKTESCQVNHLLYVISGRLSAKMNDGKEVEFNQGDMGLIPPGHDGRTVGDKPAVWLEFQH